MNLRLIPALVLGLFSGCGESEPKRKETNLETAEFTTPAIILETIDEIVTNLPEDLIKDIRGMDEGAGMVRYHMDRGMGLRNSLGLWGDSEVAEGFNSIGIYAADDMSGILLDSVKRRVLGQDLNIEEQVGFYHAYWKENLGVHEEPCPLCSEILEERLWFPLAYAEQPNLPSSAYESAEFPEVEKMLKWYQCPSGHEYVWTSETGLRKPEPKHLDARRRVVEANSEVENPFAN